MTFKSKTDAFKKDARPWLTPSSGPMVQLLDSLALSLDTGPVTAGLATAYRQTWAALMAAKPVVEPANADPINSLIEGLAS